jgi:hypothetical protein
MEIETIESIKHDIVRFENDWRIYKRYESGYWAEIDEEDRRHEYSIRHYDIEEFEKAYQDYLKTEENG